MDLLKVWSVSGGLPLRERAKQRQAYGHQELRRWREFLGIPTYVFEGELFWAGPPADAGVAVDAKARFPERRAAKGLMPRAGSCTWQTRAVCAWRTGVSGNGFRPPPRMCASVPPDPTLL